MTRNSYFGSREFDNGGDAHGKWRLWSSRSFSKRQEAANNTDRLKFNFYTSCSAGARYAVEIGPIDVYKCPIGEV